MEVGCSRYLFTVSMYHYYVHRDFVYILRGTVPETPSISHNSS